MKDNKPVNLNPAEFERNAFCHILGRGVDWQEVFDRNYWENVAFKLRPGDAIEVHSRSSGEVRAAFVGCHVMPIVCN
jgi:hypothetical protein